MHAFKDLQETNHIFGKKLTAIVVLLTDSVTVKFPCPLKLVNTLTERHRSLLRLLIARWLLHDFPQMRMRRRGWAECGKMHCLPLNAPLVPSQRIMRRLISWSIPHGDKLSLMGISCPNSRERSVVNKDFCRKRKHQLLMFIAPYFFTGLAVQNSSFCA